jgi:DNA invertase Pin-like site-specific DNA recombinase
MKISESEREVMEAVAWAIAYRHAVHSEHTKAGIAAAKKRGVKFGGPAANKAKADRFAANVVPIIHQVKASGVTTLRGIAGALTARGIPTPRGREWSAPQVANVLKRAEA